MKAFGCRAKISGSGLRCESGPPQSESAPALSGPAPEIETRGQRVLQGPARTLLLNPNLSPPNQRRRHFRHQPLQPWGVVKVEALTPKKTNGRLNSRGLPLSTTHMRAEPSIKIRAGTFETSPCFWDQRLDFEIWISDSYKILGSFRISSTDIYIYIHTYITYIHTYIYMRVKVVVQE